MHKFLQSTSRTLPLRRPTDLLRHIRTNTHAKPLTTYATFQYLENRPEYQHTKPYHINIPAWSLPPGQQCNEVSVPHSNIPVQGLRGQLDAFTLDRNGFAVAVEDKRGPDSLYDCLAYEEYMEHQRHQKRLFGAVESFLRRKMEGVEDVVAFSNQIRRRDPQFPALPRGSDASKPQPVQGVHVDFTPDCAQSEIGGALVERGYTTLKGRRWQVISTWKPLFGPLQDWPLALLDYTSLDNERDLIASDNVYTHVIRETYNVIHNEKHRWYYLENQQPDEVLLFKTFDSRATKGNARVCPHAAFEDPLAPRNARPRESFECQAVVIYPEGSMEGNSYDEVLPSESTRPE